MKTSLLLCCLLFPAIGIAQSWRIAATGGAMLNTISSNPVLIEKAPDKPGPAATLQVGYERSGWEGGLAISYRRYALQYKGDYIINYTSVCPTDIYVNTKEKFPVIAITPFLRRHFGKGKMDYYVGLSGGFTRLLDATPILFGGHFGNQESTATTGITAGIQAGCAYAINERWALLGELSVDGLWLKTFSLQSGMFTAGIQYRIKKAE